MGRKRYTVMAVGALVALLLAEVAAKIGWLGNWSAAAYVIVALVFIAIFIAALVLATTHQVVGSRRRRLRGEPARWISAFAAPGHQAGRESQRACLSPRSTLPPHCRQARPSTGGRRIPRGQMI